MGVQISVGVVTNRSSSASWVYFSVGSEAEENGVICLAQCGHSELLWWRWHHNSTTSASHYWPIPLWVPSAARCGVAMATQVVYLWCLCTNLLIIVQLTRDLLMLDWVLVTLMLVCMRCQVTVMWLWARPLLLRTPQHTTRLKWRTQKGQIALSRTPKNILHCCLFICLLCCLP